MTKHSKVLFLALLLAGAIIAYVFLKQPPPSLQHRSIPTIAITQIIEHHTLDTVRAGLMAELTSNGFDEKTAKIVYENAHGNMATATQISNKFCENLWILCV